MDDSSSGFLVKLSQAGAAASEGLSGLEISQPHGFWQEASVLHHVGVSLGLLEHPPNMAAGQVSELRAQ